jgi:hypothetical protein
MSFNECAQKFKKSVAYSAMPLLHSEKIIEIVRSLEEVPNVGEVARFMAG